MGKNKKKAAEESSDMGRPLKPIDWDKLDIMLIKGCGIMLICHRLGVSHDTIHRRAIAEGRWGRGTEYATFEEYKQAKRSIGDDSILERQYDLAMGIYDKEEKRWISPPDKTMLIWLGKQRCNQAERLNTQANIESKETGNVTHIVQIVEKPD